MGIHLKLRDCNFSVCLYIMQKKIHQPFMLIIYGPTGVGKTDLAMTIANQIPAEIINMDVGQFYTPLSIGTAKPDWKNSPVTHHLFDIIDEPVNYTVNEYRSIVYKKIEEIIARGKLPILVGGSGFYLYSLLYQPYSALASYEGQAVEIDISTLYPEDVNLWDELYKIDPVRAAAIDPSDTYRIQRALSIWHATGKLPSSFAPIYDPQADFHIIFVGRDRQELRERINNRVLEMLKSGWIEESQKLMKTPWEPFIRKKNLIGYPEVFDYLGGEKGKSAFAHMVETISAQTRQYAKRQFTFWRKLEREIKKEKRYTGMHIGCLEMVDLTSKDMNVYSSEVVNRLKI